MGKKILFIEDDRDLSKMVKIYMVREQFDVEICSNGGQAIEKFQYFQPDLVLLDLMLPEINGLEILKQIRFTSNIPVIIISAKETETDRILGLKLGADDYVTKPFSIKELLARIEALFRRIDFVQLSNQSETMRYNDITIDCFSRIVTKLEKEISLTMKEFDLLLFLAQHPNQVFSKEQIYNHVWEYNRFGDMNTVTIHIQKIREKLEDTHGIVTVRGIGYRFDGIKS